MAQPSEVQLAFTLRLFDLNQDLTLTTDEMLTSLALDAVVGAPGRVLALGYRCWPVSLPSVGR